MKRIILIFSLILSFSALFAQQRFVSGRVTDESKAPVTGASVIVPGTTIGTITDVDGNFKIQEAEKVIFEK